MCESKTKLIFCKCEDQLVGKEVIWLLERKGVRKDDSHLHIVGSMIPPSVVSINDYSPEDILEVLQNESPFDFPYKPKQGDTFRFQFRDAWSLSYNFVFTRGSWKIAGDADSQFEMLQIAEGTIHIIDLKNSKQPVFTINRYRF